MAAWDSGSAAARLPSVWLENTTPQPKVSLARFLSSTVTSCRGSAFFISRAKYRPAGPPPTQTIRMRLQGVAKTLEQPL
jgi:hypothetical protein